MNASNLFPSAIRSKISATALVAALLLSACATAVDDREVGVLQETIVTYGPPSWWNGGRVYVGRTLNSDIFAVYFSNYAGGSGNCASYQLGANGQLYNSGERAYVRGSDTADDEMLWVNGGNISVCGKVLMPLTTTPKIELHGRGGNDWFHVIITNDNAQVHGGAGDDSMVIGDIYQARGGDGADWIVGGYPTLFYGDGGGDSLCSFATHPSGAVLLADGGAGDTDSIWGLFAQTTNNEFAGTQEDCEFFRDSVYNRFND